MGYPRERKEAVLKKMLPPNNQTISEISKEEGICEGTLYNWRKAARAGGRLMPDGDTTPAGWCATDKFAAVVETAAMMFTVARLSVGKSMKTKQPRMPHC